MAGTYTLAFGAMTQWALGLDTAHCWLNLDSGVSSCCAQGPVCVGIHVDKVMAHVVPL